MRPHAPRPLLGTLASSRLANFKLRSAINTLQRGTIAYTGASTSTATIAAVDPANSTCRYNGMTQTDAAVDFSVASANVVLTNATTVTANGLTVAGTLTAAFEVSNYNVGVTAGIQRGTITQTAAGSSSATITAIQTGRTELLYLGAYTPSSGAAPTADQWCATIRLTSATAVTLTKSAGGQIVTISFEARQLP